MRHGSLFSGIGGFDLASEWMGWENVFHCEINPFGSKILKHHFPNSDSLTDITKTDFKPYANRIDILTGGFPCQPYSLAGKRLGKEDERHLWPEMLRAIREIKPSWVVGENVFGLVNWSGGLVFDEVQTDLEAEGYEVQAYILPACAKNAPHRRDRIWFVAYSDSNSRGAANSNRENKREHLFCRTPRLSVLRTSPNTNCNGLNERNCEHEVNTSERGFNALNDFNEAFMYSDESGFKGEHFCETWQRKFNGSNCGNGINNFQNFPTQSPVCNGDDGLSGRLDSITFPKWRTESIKAGGNAIVPQVAYEIFKAIDKYNNL